MAGTRSVLRERLDQVGHRAGVPGPLDQVALAERGQDHHRRDPLGRDPLGGRDPVEDRHLHVQDDQVGPQLLGELDRLLAVAGLADDVVALLGEHLGEVHPDQRLVLGDDDAAHAGVAGGALTAPGYRRDAAGLAAAYDGAVDLRRSSTARPRPLPARGDLLRPQPRGVHAGRVARSPRSGA